MGPRQVSYLELGASAVIKSGLGCYPLHFPRVMDIVQAEVKSHFSLISEQLEDIFFAIQMDPTYQ